jgi:hypothetical protein
LQKQNAGGIGEERSWRFRGLIRYLVLLRVKVVICDDGDVEASAEGPFDLCGAFRLQGER